MFICSVSRAFYHDTVDTQFVIQQLSSNHQILLHNDLHAHADTVSGLVHKDALMFNNDGRIHHGVKQLIPDMSVCHDAVNGLIWLANYSDYHVCHVVSSRLGPKASMRKY